MKKVFAPYLVRAIVRHQYATKDRGAFVDYGGCVVQVLYNTPEDLGADVGGMTRS